MHEFFRHYRPTWFNSKRQQIETLQHGGISFMLVAVEEGIYDYWIYICPKNIQFSSRAAVKRLREVKQSGTVPWGRLKLSDAPILNQLVVNAVNCELPTEVQSLITYIQQLNTLAILEKQLGSPKAAVNEYKKTN